MIDIGTVLDLIDHLVETHGEDHVADRRYVSRATRQPECGVAKVLFLLGVPVETLLSFRDRPIGFLSNADLGLELTMGARVVLERFQMAQDGQAYAGLGNRFSTWGEARVEAYSAAESLLSIVPESLLAPLLPRKELVLV